MTSALLLRSMVDCTMLSVVADTVVAVPRNASPATLLTAVSSPGVERIVPAHRTVPEVGAAPVVGECILSERQVVRIGGELQLLVLLRAVSADVVRERRWRRAVDGHVARPPPDAPVLMTVVRVVARDADLAQFAVSHQASPPEVRAGRRAGAGAFLGGGTNVGLPAMTADTMPFSASSESSSSRVSVQPSSLPRSSLASRFTHLSCPL